MQKFAIPKHHPRASKFWCQKRIHAEMSCFGGWRPSLVGSLQSRLVFRSLSSSWPYSVQMVAQTAFDAFDTLSCLQFYHC